METYSERMKKIKWCAENLSTKYEKEMMVHLNRKGKFTLLDVKRTFKRQLITQIIKFDGLYAIIESHPRGFPPRFDYYNMATGEKNPVRIGRSSSQIRILFSDRLPYDYFP